MPDRDDYMLGTSDEELERLGYQHQVWLDEAVRLWRLAQFGPGQRLADLGCGPGFATLDLAHLVGREGRIEAVEASPKFIHHLENQLMSQQISQVKTHVGDVHRLDLPDTSLDGAFARWVLCFVENPTRVCNEVARVLKPGGIFTIMDYFNYLAADVLPRRESLSKLFSAYHRSALQHGGSYDIGDRLPDLLQKAGFEILNLKPIVRIAPPQSREWQWVSLFNQVYIPQLVQLGIWTEFDRQEFNKAWATAEEDPATFFFTPPMIAIVARKI